ncbi:flagellar brake protein [Reinekea sp.]|jgi:c-di-GMP-binding flagellar brake protein YcgR|uniref:flagellar brake protein n=1 Tax=Reinekea sp. TaxID=1970455 RepID=UPI002A80F4F0|nr:flagellar brake protein [Reinekea sp.]
MTESNAPTFDSLKLLPGQVLQLEFEGYDSNRDRSQLVGYYRGRTIIISTPTKQGVAMSVKPKTGVRVRLFVNQINGACAFESTVQHVSVTPFPHLYLTMPAKLYIGEVRKSIRAKVNVITSIVILIGSQRKSVPAVIDDLSINGARMFCQKLPTALDEEINIVFKVSVSGIERIMRIRAIVRSTQLNEDQGNYFYGLQFVDVSDSDRITLHAFVLSQLHNS